MENPASWTRAEHVVNDVLDEIAENEARPPGQRLFGWSRAMQITSALRREGLLNEDAPVSDVDVQSARLRQATDKKLNKETPDWIIRLAKGMSPDDGDTRDDA